MGYDETFGSQTLTDAEIDAFLTEIQSIPDEQLERIWNRTKEKIDEQK